MQPTHGIGPIEKEEAESLIKQLKYYFDDLKDFCPKMLATISDERRYLVVFSASSDVNHRISRWMNGKRICQHCQKEICFLSDKEWEHTETHEVACNTVAQPYRGELGY